jgi:hypothetical protein
MNFGSTHLILRGGVVLFMWMQTLDLESCWRMYAVNPISRRLTPGMTGSGGAIQSLSKQAL